jgi:16S rRNA (guanine966-N2)-methyltransferase
VFVERDRAALQALRANIAALGLADRTTIVTSDVPAWVPALRGVDLALVDPPYEFDGWTQLLGLLRAPYVVAESGREIDPPTEWNLVKSRRYGRTWVSQLERVA